MRDFDKSLVSLYNVWRRVVI